MLEHDPGPKHGVVRLRLLDLTASERVEWACISGHPAESPASLRIGTRFVFEMSERTCVIRADRERG